MSFVSRNRHCIVDAKCILFTTQVFSDKVFENFVPVANRGQASKQLGGAGGEWLDTFKGAGQAAGLVGQGRAPDWWGRACRKFSAERACEVMPPSWTNSRRERWCCWARKCSCDVFEAASLGLPVSLWRKPPFFWLWSEEIEADGWQHQWRCCCTKPHDSSEWQENSIHVIRGDRIAGWSSIGFQPLYAKLCQEAIIAAHRQQYGASTDCSRPAGFVRLGRPTFRRGSKPWKKTVPIFDAQDLQLRFSFWLHRSECCEIGVQLRPIPLPGDLEVRVTGTKRVFKMAKEAIAMDNKAKSYYMSFAAWAGAGNAPWQDVAVFDSLCWMVADVELVAVSPFLQDRRLHLQECDVVVEVVFAVCTARYTLPTGIYGIRTQKIALLYILRKQEKRACRATAFTTIRTPPKQRRLGPFPLSAGRVRNQIAAGRRSVGRRSIGMVFRCWFCFLCCVTAVFFETSSFEKCPNKLMVFSNDKVFWGFLFLPSFDVFESHRDSFSLNFRNYTMG